MAEGGRAGAIEPAVLRDGVAALYGHRPQALVVGMVFLVIFLWAFGPMVDRLPLWLWSTGMVLMTLNGLYWLRDYRRDSAQSGWDARRHLRLYTLQSWLAGLMFGLTGWLFYDPQFGEARWMVVLFLCSLAAGTVTVYAYHVPTFLGFLVLLAMPLALRFWDVGAPGGWVAYALMAFYMGMLASFAVRQGRMLNDALRTRHHNAALVRQLEEKTQALERANDAKARFFAAASHDLRQPLQALGHYTELLEPGRRDAPHVERIRECVDSLDGLLEGVLTISRLDAGEVPRHLQAVDLVALLRRLLTLYGGVAEARGLQLRMRVSGRYGDAPGIWVQTDPVLLERVMGNLLGNALRYTERGGVLLTARRAGARVRLQVIDTGIGIAPEHQERIFDEFVQLGNPHRGDAQGVGLGLATVRRICKLLDHPLGLRSGAGRGSTFTLVLPAAEPATALAQDGTPATVADLTGDILLVEDNPLVRESLHQNLARWGLRVQSCTSADEALLRLQAGPVQAILSDWRLPGATNGLDLLRRAGDVHPACLRLLMTGEPAESLGPLPPGITLLKKPVRPLRLRALLSTRLQAQAGAIAVPPH